MATNVKLYFGFAQKVSQHKTLHFRPFLAKTNESIFRKGPKPPFLGLFGPFFRK